MSTLRQIVLDTETTGLEPREGHRIIEIGCVELVNRRHTSRTFHVYLQPDREIDEGAIEVHGITNEFLKDKPRFADIVDEFLEFVHGAELIIHNAPFDVGFLNHELALLGDRGRLEDHCRILDTLALARRMHPGQRNSLDALCKRYGVDNSGRELHGALLDAEILADVYLAMTGGQASLLPAEEEPGPGTEATGRVGHGEADRIGDKPPLRVIRASEEEIQAHEAFLDAIRKSGAEPLWKNGRH